MEKCIVEYVWIGGENELRSKSRVINGEINDVSELPVWNYDGSSTKQAEGNASEVLLIPCALFNDPFRGHNHKLVLCETMRPDGTYLENSHRHWAKELFDQALEEEPWFGLEQEYFMISPKTKKPMGYDCKKTQGQYYCSAGASNTFGRSVAEDHLIACLYAGIKISGVNAEVAPGQWEYQVGPCTGIEQGDHLWMARYIMERVSEKYNVIIDIEPKPLMGDWNGSGCHANYSTKSMRDGCEGKDGIDFIYEAVDKLSKKHSDHMQVYGLHNEQRLSGYHETSPYDEFSTGIGNRGSSVRIGNDAINNKKGYFEDRRPGSNCDPYLVTGMLFKTTVL